MTALISQDAFWIPEGEGKWSRPLRFLPGESGWVELMRLDPGVRLGLHRHTGLVHAYNVQGSRRLCTGRVPSSPGCGSRSSPAPPSSC